MTPEQWQELKVQLQAAIELEPAQRSAYVRELTAKHPVLGKEIQSLLASYLRMKTDFLDVRSTRTERTAGDTSAAFLGRQLGSYQVIEQIGSGGMGEVFRAFRADDQYKKLVAIKLMRAGLDSTFVVSRFKNERQILATLDHPNIARLLDGGATEDGIPYLVMELVEGVPIDAYCDSHKLPTTERLKIFLQVCSAVQYAHQHLIIHRDIKPSNILVTADGVPKLLDFGIAKILDPSAVEGSFENTLTLFRLLTPGYASPEQVRGEHITTASDVYSLGVILYEILTGRSPYGRRNRTSGEISRAVCEFDPERPSAVISRAITDDHGATATPEQISLLRDGSLQRLRKRLRGDLDNIVLMALRKEPQRRYSSVEVFAADISRHLDDLPVIARGDSARYRAGKFVTRHKASVSAAIAMAITLLLGLGITLREARIARAERARAEQRFRDVRELANSDLFQLHDALQQLPGSAAARNLVIQRDLKYLEQLNQDAAGDRDLMHDLAGGYERIAALQGNFSGPGIGDTAAALASYEKALALREQLVSVSNGNLNELKAEVQLMGAYVQSLEKAGRTGPASRIARQAVAISERVMEQNASDASAQMAAAYANLQLALVMGGAGSSSTTREIPAAISNLQQATRILQGLADRHNENAPAFYARARLLLAFQLSKERRFGESEQVFNDALSSENHRSSPSSTYLEDVYSYRGIMFERLGKHERALADYKRFRAIAQSLVRADPHDLNEQQRLQIADAHIAVETALLGRTGAHQQALDLAVTNGERMFAVNPSELFYRNLLTGGYYYQGELFSIARRPPDAIKLCSKALATAKSIHESDPDDLESPLNMGKIRDALGVALAQDGQHEKAKQEFDASLLGVRGLLQLRPEDAEALYVSDLVRKHAALLESCSLTKTCAAVGWQLASPLN